LIILKFVGRLVAIVAAVVAVSMLIAWYRFGSVLEVNWPNVVTFCSLFVLLKLVFDRPKFDKPFENNDN
jgi:hypothetical protein